LPPRHAQNRVLELERRQFARLTGSRERSRTHDRCFLLKLRANPYPHLPAYSVLRADKESQQSGEGEGPLYLEKGFDLGR
jgi:hypothetical protein